MAGQILSLQALLYIYLGMVVQSFCLILMTTMKCFEKDVRHIFAYCGAVLLLFTQSLLVIGVKIMVQNDSIVVDFQGGAYERFALQEDSRF